MTWKLSCYRAGDLVEVRSKDEILATLDERGCVDGMPFMPEMLQFCGRQFCVRAVAHKTCDTERNPCTARRVSATVHLADLRCDGSAHGGCQAECTLFWKDVWLKPAADRKQDAPAVRTITRCSDGQLQAATLLPISPPGSQPCYSCQATRLYDASNFLPWWDVRQYVFDILTGNCSVGRVVRVTWLGMLRWRLRSVPFGYRICKSFTESMHRLLTGRAAPFVNAKIKRGDPTPTGRLNLKPGEYVRIRPQEEIEQTIDESRKNRGLSFDCEEMAPYCGKVFRVHKIVTQIIDEPTGKMRQMKQPCVMLEGVVCNSEYATCRLNCPRAIPCYWRELWLERVSVAEPASTEATANKRPGAVAGIAG